ncbi:MAG: outer membrane lipoprotein-sorting protein [Chthoniobacterales bacterium]
MKALPLLALLMFAANVRAETTAISADQLAGKMGAAVEDGDSTARVRMKTSGGNILQVQIKSRRSGGRAVTVYEILWPAERKGEKAILRQSKGSAPEGETVSASGARAKVSGAQVGEGVFGTDLSYADAIENFFLWPDQKIGGEEKVGKVGCVILESRPSGPSPHGKVRTWIDPEKSVVHRVEKYDKSGRLLRTIATTQVAKDDTGRNVPAGLTISRPGGSSTEIDGSNIRHDVQLTDADLAVP